MIYRITYGFSGKGQGWTETHAFKATSEIPAVIYAPALALALKRKEMLGREFELVGVRVSRYATDAGVRARGVFFRRQGLKNSNQTKTAAAEPADVAYLVRGTASQDNPGTEFDANTNQSFLGGPMDDSVNDAGEVDESKSGLGAAFAGWRESLQSVQTGLWGWLASKTILEKDVASIAQNPNGTVTYTFAAGDLATLTAGAVYKVRTRQVNQGVSPLNRELKFRVTSATTLTTQRVVGIPTAQTGGTVRVYSIIQPFVQIGDASLQGQVGNHKRGRPFGSKPGRAKRQILG